jgi:hypothetical protein
MKLNKRYVLVNNFTGKYVSRCWLNAYTSCLRDAFVFSTKEEAREEKELVGAGRERIVPVVMKWGHPVLSKV